MPAAYRQRACTSFSEREYNNLAAHFTDECQLFTFGTALSTLHHFNQSTFTDIRLVQFPLAAYLSAVSYI